MDYIFVIFRVFDARGIVASRSGLARLEGEYPAGGPLAQGAALDLQYDNEILLGDYLYTAQFDLKKDQPPQAGPGC